jgi:hypothetical protein
MAFESDVVPACPHDIYDAWLGGHGHEKIEMPTYRHRNRALCLVLDRRHGVSSGGFK